MRQLGCRYNSRHQNTEADFVPTTDNQVTMEIRGDMALITAGEVSRRLGTWFRLRTLSSYEAAPGDIIRGGRCKKLA